MIIMHNLFSSSDIYVNLNVQTMILAKIMQILQRVIFFLDNLWFLYLFFSAFGYMYPRAEKIKYENQKIETLRFLCLNVRKVSLVAICAVI